MLTKCMSIVCVCASNSMFPRHAKRRKQKKTQRFVFAELRLADGRNETQCCWLAQTQHDGAMTFVTYNAIASSRAGCSCWLVRASGRCMLCASLGCGHLSRTDASKSFFRVPFEMKTFFLEPPFLGKSPTPHLLTPH